jgi:hypothetical protein
MISIRTGADLAGHSRTRASRRRSTGGVVPLDASPADTGSLRGDLIAVLQAVNRRSLAAQAVPDPGGELTA